MAARVSSDALLVGSLPTESTERAFRDGGELFGDLTFALPDGESGPRGAWVAHDRVALLEPHPDVEVVAPSPAPDRRARHAYDTARPTVREHSAVLHAVRAGDPPRTVTGARGADARRST